MSGRSEEPGRRRPGGRCCRPDDGRRGPDGRRERDGRHELGGRCCRTDGRHERDGRRCTTDGRHERDGRCRRTRDGHRAAGGRRKRGGRREPGDRCCTTDGHRRRSRADRDRASSNGRRDRRSAGRGRRAARDHRRQGGHRAAGDHRKRGGRCRRTGGPRARGDRCRTTDDRRVPAGHRRSRAPGDRRDRAGRHRSRRAERHAHPRSSEPCRRCDGPEHPTRACNRDVPGCASRPWGRPCFRRGSTRDRSSWPDVRRRPSCSWACSFPGLFSRTWQNGGASSEASLLRTRKWRFVIARARRSARGRFTYSVMFFSVVAVETGPPDLQTHPRTARCPEPTE